MYIFANTHTIDKYNRSTMKIAVDFDGTIVEHDYPRIGKINLFAFETLKQLQKEGHDLIFWTSPMGVCK